MFVLDLDYKVCIKGHGWKGSWMKMVCPCYLLCKKKEVLSMSTNVGNPKCNIQDGLGINKSQFSAPITVTIFKLTLSDNRFGKSCKQSFSNR